MRKNFNNKKLSTTIAANFLYDTTVVTGTV